MEANNTTYAPVIIPTLNRFEHFQRCVESLLCCTHADKTELIVGLDYPPEEKYEEGWKRIGDYLGTINGFRKVTIIKRDHNYGAVANYMDLIQIANRTYDRFIFSEDDNVFSPNFLDFINKGLDEFELNPSVFAICGYSFPLDLSNYPHNYYYSQDMCAWGYASWKKKFSSVIDHISKPTYLRDYYRNQPLSFFIKHNLRFLNNVNYFGKGFYFDVFVSSYLHLQNSFVVVPAISKVRNCGHDGTGLNSTTVDTNDFFSNQIIDTNASFCFDEYISMETNPIIVRQLDAVFDTTFRTKVVRVFMFLLLRLFLIIQK